MFGSRENEPLWVQTALAILIQSLGGSRSPQATGRVGTGTFSTRSPRGPRATGPPACHCGWAGEALPSPLPTGAGRAGRWLPGAPPHTPRRENHPRPPSSPRPAPWWVPSALTRPHILRPTASLSRLLRQPKPPASPGPDGSRGLMRALRWSSCLFPPSEVDQVASSFCGGASGIPAAGTGTCTLPARSPGRTQHVALAPFLLAAPPGPSPPFPPQCLCGGRSPPQTPGFDTKATVSETPSLAPGVELACPNLAQRPALSTERSLCFI